MSNYTITYCKLYNSGDEFPCNSSGIETYHNNWNEFEYLYQAMEHINELKDYFFDIDYTGSPGLMSCYDGDDINEENEDNIPTMVIMLNCDIKKNKDNYRETLLELVCQNLIGKKEDTYAIINNVSILEFVINMLNKIRFNNVY